MTYNVFWEVFDYTKQPQCRSRSGVNKCVNVMAYFIAYYLPDILCIQEIRQDVQWPHLHAALRHYIPTFDTMYTWRGTVQGAAGMMTLFRSNKFRVVKEEAGDFLGPENTTTSGRPYLALQLDWHITRPADKASERNLLVVNVHMPHNGELLPQTADKCFQTLQSVLSTTPHNFLVVAGDFNRDPEQRQLNMLGLRKHPNDTFLTAYNSRTGKITHKCDHIYSTLPYGADALSYHRVPYLPTDAEQSEFHRLMFKNTGPTMSDHYPVLATYPLPLNDYYSGPSSPPADKLLWV